MRIFALCSGLGAIVLATLALASAPAAREAPGRPLAPDEMRRAVGACQGGAQCSPLLNEVCGFNATTFSWSPSYDCTSGVNPSCAHTATGIYNCAKTFARIFGCLDGGADGTCNPAAVQGNCGQKYSCTDFSVQCVNGTCRISGVVGCTEMRGVFCESYQSCRAAEKE